MRDRTEAGRWAAAGLGVLAALVLSGSPLQVQERERGRQGRLVRAYFDDRLIAAGAVISLDVLESEYEKGYLVVRATEDDVDALRRAGMRVVEDSPGRAVRLRAADASASRSGTIPGYPCYRTVEQTYADAEAIVEQHPHLATWSVVGKSWKKEQRASDGYDLKVLRLTNSAASGAKPVLLITTAVHAREYVTAELGTRFAERLVEAHETDADVRWLLDHQEVHIVLHANPDGRKRAEEGLLWRKNHNTNHCPDSWPGVDLNRNFDFKFGHPGGSSDAACSQTHRGTSAASEPETRAISAYMDALFPDARGPADDDAAPADTSGLFLDIHSHGRLVLWPWGHVDEAAPNAPALRTLGRKLAFFNGHTPMQAIGLYPTSGTTEDYAYGALGRAAFTYELGTTFFQGCSDFEDSILEVNLASLLYGFKAAREPYVIPAGPDVLDLSLGGNASTTGVGAGTTVTLSATLDDTRYENGNGEEPSQNIAAGEYYVDVPPWGDDAAAVAVAASDGTFDSDAEEATASIDTTGWGAGRHTVFVRARDADDNWGAVSAVFLFVDTAPPATPAAPTLAAGTGQLTAAWTAPADNGAPVSGYRLRYKPTGRHFGWSVVDPGTSLRFTIEDLPNEEVAVQMRALNAIGGSAWSPSATATPEPVQSPEQEPPPPRPSGGGGGGRRPVRPNRPPEAVGTLAALPLTVGASPARVDVAPAFRDADRDALTYAATSSAQEVAVLAVEGSVVTVTPVGAGTAVITVTAADGREPNTPATQAFTVTVTVDYDADADGLIEVRTLVQLDALRHDLDGDGVPTEAGAEAHAAAFEGAVSGLSCGGAGCRGYELLAELDFDTNGSGGADAGDAFWNGGSGWVPIGTGAEPFAAAFEGNGRVIRGLFAAGGDGAGLFGATGPLSLVARVGLVAVDVAGTASVGALAGLNGGLVTAVWATGRVSGTASVGGLAGSNAGDIGGSYAAVAVSGERQAGGLVGLNEGGLAAVYATGRVSGTASVGGLVGHHRGTLTASYATGRVRGERDAGGLVGVVSEPGTVTASYWDQETSGLRSSAAGRGLTSSALQRVTAYGGPYAGWNVDADGDGAVDGPWHLGTAAQYPVLTLDVDGDGTANWQELGRQLRAGPALTVTPTAMPAEVVLTWTVADTSAWTPSPPVTYTVTREAVAPVETVAAGVRGARYVDTALQPGSTYTYQVAAVVDGGEAVRSALTTAAVPCAYAVTPLHRDVLWTAGRGQAAVTTGAGCAWTAASESGFLAVTAGTEDSGPGTVRYTVAANRGGPRRGTLAVAGRRVTVYQASPTAFTDHPVERGATPVKAIHFLELRARIDALRAGAGRPAFRWTDPVLTPGATPIKGVHLTELRAALADAYSAAGRAAPAYTDPLLAAGATAIRAAHLMELRAAVAALE